MNVAIQFEEEEEYEQQDSGIFVSGNLFNPRDPAHHQDDHSFDQFICFRDRPGCSGRAFTGVQRGETVELL
ncbi:MAG TPA: hypothetical protein VF905_00330, partial [Nitrospirota bacterium]